MFKIFQTEGENYPKNKNQNVVNSIKATLDTRNRKSYFQSINGNEIFNLDFPYNHRSMTIVRNKYGFTVLALITKTNIKNTSVIRTQKTKKKKNPGGYFQIYGK